MVRKVNFERSANRTSSMKITPDISVIAASCHTMIIFLIRQMSSKFKKSAYCLMKETRMESTPEIFIHIPSISMKTMPLYAAITALASTMVPLLHFDMIPIRHSTTISTHNSTMVPTQDSITMPKKDSTMVPKQDSTMVPKQDLIMVPEQDSTIVPKQDSTMVSKQDSTMVSKQDLTLISIHDSTIMSTQDSTMIPLQDSTMTPIQESTIISIQDSTMITVQDSIVTPIQDFTIISIQDSIMKPINDSTMIPTKDSTMPPTKESTMITTNDSTMKPTSDSTMKPKLDFKSIFPAVKKAEEMGDYIDNALSYQDMFECKTSPWEMKEWNYDDLQNIKIEVDMIDRLYYIEHTDDGVSGSTFHLLARMIHNADPEKRLFVEMVASCDFTGFDCQGGGEIFITSYPNIFFQVTLRNDYNRDAIYRSMLSDGYHIEDNTEHFSHPSSVTTKNSPMLKFLCHMAVINNKEKLQHYPQVLPKLLKESIDEFIQIRESIDAYDSWE